MFNRLLISIFSASILLTSCRKDLDIKPTDVVEETAAIQNISGLDKALNTVYSRYASARANRQYISSITSDEVKFGPNNGGSGQFGFRWQYNADATSGGDVTAGMGAYYSLIDQANRIISRAPELTAAGPAEEAQRASIVGQALALRAMAHFELLEAYSKRYNAADPLGVFVVTKSCLTCYPSRSSVAAVLTQVEQDLTAAKAALPTPTAANYNDLILNSISVTAIQARVALYKGEWQRAADFATTVINSNVKTLATGSGFQQIWSDGNQNELLFRLRLELSSILGAQWTSTNGNVIFSPSDKLLAAYGTNDIRRTTYIATGNGSGTPAVANGVRYVNKFARSSRGGSIVDVKAIRIAEMYLIRAEARAELNDLPGAAQDIATLRAARIAPAPTVSYADKATAIADIMLERFRELAFEGFRFFDLKRRNLPVERLASDVDSPLWQTLPANDFRFVYPIPAREILANPNAAQNAGY